MKNFKSMLQPAAGLFLFAAILIVLYSLVISGVAYLFPKSRNGHVIEAKGTKYSQLIGQNYRDPRHMWGRAMELTTCRRDGELLLYSKPSNLSPSSKEYDKIIAARIEKIRAANPDMAYIPVPVDLVTNSGSGLDPDISVSAALYQVPRIARARGVSQEEIHKIIEKCTSRKFLWLLGDKSVNVLKVNLMLDHIL